MAISAEAGSVVKVYNGTTLLGTATESLTTPGSFSFTPPSSLASGFYNLTVTATDAANNVSASSTPFALSVSTVADTVAPVLQSLNATAGNYKAGSAIDIVAHFDEPVIINTGTGSPTLSLNNGGVATYLSGGGTSDIRFRYIVPASGNESVDPLDVLGWSTNGSIAADASGNVAQVAIVSGTNNLAHSTDVNVDLNPPAITSITSAVDPTDAGILNLFVNFSENVSVSTPLGGLAPILTLSNGQQASYVGKNASQLIFKYVLQPGDVMSNLNVTALAEQDTVISDQAGNQALVAINSGNGLHAQVAAGPFFGTTLNYSLYDEAGNLLSEGIFTTDKNTGFSSVELPKGYTGAALLKVSDADPNAPDYVDEFTGLATSLNGQSLRAMIPAGDHTGQSITISPLTELAAMKAGAIPGQPLTPEQLAINDKIGQLFGLQNISTSPVTFTLDQGYSAMDGLSAGEAYGRLLAVFSAADALSGSMQDTLANLDAGIVQTLTGQWQISSQALDLMTTAAAHLSSVYPDVLGSGQAVSSRSTGVVEDHVDTSHGLAGQQPLVQAAVTASSATEGSVAVTEMPTIPKDIPAIPTEMPAIPTVIPAIPKDIPHVPEEIPGIPGMNSGKPHYSSVAPLESQQSVFKDPLTMLQNVDGIKPESLRDLADILTQKSLKADFDPGSISIQSLVTDYNHLMAYVEGDVGTIKPNQLQLDHLGLSQIDTLPKLAIFQDVLKAGHHDFAQVRAIADAIDAINGIAGARGSLGLIQPEKLFSTLTTLGLDAVGSSPFGADLFEASMGSVRAALSELPQGSSILGSYKQLAVLVEEVVDASSKIAEFASTGNATTTLADIPTAIDYAKARISGVDESNVADINQAIAIRSPFEPGQDVHGNVSALVTAHFSWERLASTPEIAPLGFVPGFCNLLGLSGFGHSTTPAKESLLKLDLVDHALATGAATDLHHLSDISSSAQALVDLMMGQSEDVSGLGGMQLATLGFADVDAQTANSLLMRIRAGDFAQAMDAKALNTDGIEGFSAQLQSAINQTKGAWANLEAYRSGQGFPPTLVDYERVGLSGVSENNLAAVNAQLKDASDLTGVDALGQLAGVVQDADQALARLMTSNGHHLLTLADYAAAGVTGVNVRNLTAVNAHIESHQGEVPTGPALERWASEANAFRPLFAAQHRLESWGRGDGHGHAPSVNDYFKAGITGVDKNNLAAVNAQLHGSGDFRGAGLSQWLEVVRDKGNAALAKVAEFASDPDSLPGGSLTIADLNAAGIFGATPGNHAAVLSQLQKLEPAQLGDMDALKHCVSQANHAIATIDLHTAGRGLMMRPLGLEAFEAAGVYGVNIDNLHAVNAQIMRAPLASASSVNGIERIVSRANLAIDKINQYLGHDSTDTPTVSDYWGAGFMGVHEGNLAAVNQQILLLHDQGADVLAYPQSVTDHANMAIARIEGLSGYSTQHPYVADYAMAGIQGVTADNLDLVNAIMAQNPLGGYLDTRLIQSQIDRADSLEGSWDGQQQGYGDVGYAVMANPIESMIVPGDGHKEEFNLLEAIQQISAQQKTPVVDGPTVTLAVNQNIPEAYSAEGLGYPAEGVMNDPLSVWVGGEKVFEDLATPAAVIEGAEPLVPANASDEVPVNQEQSKVITPVGTAVPFAEDWKHQHG
jgi:hypothetical protein